MTSTIQELREMIEDYAITEELCDDTDKWDKYCVMLRQVESLEKIFNNLTKNYPDYLYIKNKLEQTCHYFYFQLQSLGESCY